LTTCQASCLADGSKPVVGLVQEEQFRIAGQRNRDVQATLLAAGQPHDPAVALAGEPDDVDHLVDRTRMRVAARVHRDRLGHGQVAIDPGRLEHDPDPRLELGAVTARVEAQHGDLAAVPAPVALEDLDRCRLAGTVRPEQREDLAERYVEVDARDGVHAAVGLDESAYSHRIAAGHIASSRVGT
jgi:hypothetical protein